MTNGNKDLGLKTRGNKTRTTESGAGMKTGGRARGVTAGKNSNGMWADISLLASAGKKAGGENKAGGDQKANTGETHRAPLPFLQGP